MTAATAWATPWPRSCCDAAARSVGQHHGEVYRVEVRYTCEDLDVLRRRLRTLERDIERLLEAHEVGRLLTTIDGIGPQTSARLVATFGDFSNFPSGAAVAAYVGAIPGLWQSGTRRPMRAGLTAIGAADLRAKLWMPVLVAVRRNPWLRAYYARLIARGKLPKVALIAAMRKLLHAVYRAIRFVPRSRAGSTYSKYASPAAFARRLAAGPFSPLGHLRAVGGARETPLGPLRVSASRGS